jgi:hypothetical protein
MEKTKVKPPPDKDKKQVPPSLANILTPRPSLIPGVQYPTTKREERLMDLAWQHAVNCKWTGGSYE